MENHAVVPSQPRNHRPRAPTMSTQIPSLIRSQSPISLLDPRPENERHTNEYVETPLRVQQIVPPPHPPRHNRPPVRLVSPLQRPHPQLRPLPAFVSNEHAASSPPPPPSSTVTKQPASFSKNPATDACNTRPSIMCTHCGRCRCCSCTQPKPLPTKWICKNSCLLSAESIIDYTSCLCCVKGVFYHCSEGDGDESCADNPCGCDPDRRLARWGCLTALSCVLPCLWLYWPLRGCKKVVEECYGRYSRNGCRCRPPVPKPEKTLLDSNSDF